MQFTHREIAVGRWWPAHFAVALITLVYTMAGGRSDSLGLDWVALPRHLLVLIALDGAALWLLTRGRILVWRDKGFYRGMAEAEAAFTPSAAEVERAIVELRYIARRAGVKALAIHAGIVAGFALALSMTGSSFMPGLGWRAALAVGATCLVVAFVTYRLLDRLDTDVEAHFAGYPPGEGERRKRNV